MSHNWYRHIFGFSVYLEGLTTSLLKLSTPLNFQTGISHEGIFLPVLWWRSVFDLRLVIRDPEIESCCSNALQGRRKDLSSQEASLIWYNFSTIKWMAYNLISSSRAIDCHRKKSIYISSKVDFCRRPSF